MNIKVPRELKAKNLSEFLSKNNELLNNDVKYDKIILDMTSSKWITPTGIVTLMSLMRLLLKKDIAHKYKLIRPGSNLDSYLKRIDFYSNLGLDMEEGIRRDSTGRFQELIKIDSHERVRDVTSDLAKIIENKAEVTDRLIDDLKSCLGEILENIFHHSCSPIDGYVCAQSYSKISKKIEFAIADAGVGIRQSLRKNPKYKNIQEDTKALSLALKKGVTGNIGEQAATGLSNTGEGLYFIKEAIKNNNGRFLIYSGNGLMTLNDGDEPTFSNVPYWQGTIVSLVINLNHELALYENLDNEIEEDDEEDWDMFEIKF